MGLLELLYREGFLDEEGMKAATHAAERAGGDRLVSVLLRQGLISEERLLEALARFHGVDLWPPNQLAVLVHAAQTACAPAGLTEAMARRLEFVLSQMLLATRGRYSALWPRTTEFGYCPTRASLP